MNTVYAVLRIVAYEGYDLVAIYDKYEEAVEAMAAYKEADVGAPDGYNIRAYVIGETHPGLTWLYEED